ncbi:hypothetical protein ACKFKF_12825 [Phormidesmis sp. 146-12]
MAAKSLSRFFKLNHRYARSVNLERDLDNPSALRGYVLTERAIDALRRILQSMVLEGENRAWTLTGVYGTGKSAFAQFLTALFASAGGTAHQQALAIAVQALGKDSPDYQVLVEKVVKHGLFRAVATAQREPLSHTILRALDRGAACFWVNDLQKPQIAYRLADLAIEVEAGMQSIDSRQVLQLLKEVAQSAKTDILLVIDELGKILEYTAQHQTTDDLFLLQQLAERPRTQVGQVYVIGLLHQSFADYSHRLGSAERNEWAKIQGRFEDIPFTESPEQLTRLIGEVIDRSSADGMSHIIHQRAEAWRDRLYQLGTIREIPANVFTYAYPLHPITALVLPRLCTRYAQNDRSLFTFLTSSEPFGFKQFLEDSVVQNNSIPMLRLHQVYDYFVESVGTNLASRPNFQRWAEVQGLISDVRHLDEDSLGALKTIGILNLVTATGVMRASRELVVLALCNHPTGTREQRHWEKVIDQLQARGLITYRKQLNELRIWEGSDFDADAAVTAWIERERLSLAEVLMKFSPLKPLVAQRHSYRTGTLRYFERRYLDRSQDLTKLVLSDRTADGLIGYWVDERIPDQVPSQTADGKPFVIVPGTQLETLRGRSLEYAALKHIQAQTKALATDGVARREVRYRLIQAKQLLDDGLQQAFAMVNQKVWVEGEPIEVLSMQAFQAILSGRCDRIYDKGWTLWNELINRRELTTQGAKARRELLEAMLVRASQEQLGLAGQGPEVSMYASLLVQSGIHRREEGVWGFYPPSQPALQTVWDAIWQFCRESKHEARSLSQLYTALETAPYGLKRGAIPILLAAVLLHCAEEVSIYKDGTFIPILGAEHFELLVKDPGRFAVKYLGFSGLRAQIFERLEAMLVGSAVMGKSGVRNGSLLAAMKPLFQFVRKLPPFTTKTTRYLSPIAQSVLRAIVQAQEPDKLFFMALPRACKVSAIEVEALESKKYADEFCRRLQAALQEIQMAYPELLKDCKLKLYESFAVSGEIDKLREDLRVRSRHLLKQCIDPVLKRFITAAIADQPSDQEWLEAVLMIIADKPAESWTDDDVAGFEAALQELGRKFKNLEALSTDMEARSKEGFEVRRITMTRPDGQEVNRLVWMDKQQQSQVDDVISELLARTSFRDNLQLQQVLAARLAEAVLGENKKAVSTPKLKRQRKSS